MARLTIEGLRKLYGEFRALDDVSLAVDNGEFLAILGASGCGKTTLLRQIAGFDRPDAGRILIGDTVVSTPSRQLPPEQRHIGIVFQSYALWPHMTVAQNVAYGLDVAGVKDPERARRVDAALALVDLAGFGDRRCCRVASASASRSPAVSSPSRRWCCSTSRSPTSTCICVRRWKRSSRGFTSGPERR